MPFVYLPGYDLLFWHVLANVDVGRHGYWLDLSYYYYFYAWFVAAIVVLVAWHRLQWRQMIAPPRMGDFPPALKLTAYTFVFSIAAAFALFYPLSFVFPDFVNYWYIQAPPVVYHDGERFPWGANLLGLVTLVVLAPVLEEFAFRGLLLHRWTPCWGINRAIIVSSLIFGIAHSDPIGAMAFGIAMSILYLRTQTLLVPIICHAAYNLFVWLLAVGYLYWDGPGYVYTLQDFQAEWPWGVGAAALSVLWGYSYLTKNPVQERWSLPRVESRSR